MRILAHIRSSTIIFLAAAGYLFPSAGSIQAQTVLQQRGEVISRGMCGGCHAVGTTGESPLPAAPRFRTLADQIDLSKLPQRMRDGLWSGHEDMPMFRFNREDAEAVVAYMRSIQAR
jgi:mono/diheme cytochrome c family protein